MSCDFEYDCELASRMYYGESGYRDFLFSPSLSSMGILKKIKTAAVLLSSIYWLYKEFDWVAKVTNCTFTTKYSDGGCSRSEIWQKAKQILPMGPITSPLRHQSSNRTVIKNTSYLLSLKQVTHSWSRWQRLCWGGRIPSCSDTCTCPRRIRGRASPNTVKGNRRIRQQQKKRTVDLITRERISNTSPCNAGLIRHRYKKQLKYVNTETKTWSL